jgi:hypothetical protein
MLKTIKTNKQMRLDELIKYVWDNGITNTTFKSNYSAIVRINEHGDVSTTNIIHRNDLFTVEIEEPITEDTEFYSLLGIYTRDGVLDSFGMNYCSVKDIKNYPLDVTHVLKKIIYLDDFDHVQTVWERDEE